MSARVWIAVLFLLSIPQADAKGKKKQLLPDVVLRAQTVVVVIRPDAGEPLSDPKANRNTQDGVEKALMEWGRFRLMMDTQTADLIIAVRKAYSGGPTISNSPVDNRPVIVQGSGGDVRVGGQQGGSERKRGPHLSNDIGPSEDTFEVYLGARQDPLDSPPIWRYSAKNALNGPQVDAVEQFRKAIVESEKQYQQNPDKLLIAGPKGLRGIAAS